MERMRTPRPSTIDRLEDGSPNPEWAITEDGYEFKKGDKVYNYYDGEWVTVLSDPMGSDDPMPEYYRGWFNTTGGTLNSVRVSKHIPRR